MEQLSDIWTHGKTIKSTLWGLVLLVSSLFLNYAAGTYATVHASNTVKDIILDNIPVYNVNFIYIDGIVIFFIFVGILCAIKPQRAPFIIKAISLFIIIRAFFVILTHLGPMVHSVTNDPDGIVGNLTFDGDMFFSGHTGLPFLMCLIFWENKKLRITFFILSIIFGSAMLLGHLHYSIDVFSAFFITYGIYKISTKFFAASYRVLEKSFEIKPELSGYRGIPIKHPQSS